VRNRLEELRRQRGLLQEQLALALGVSRQTICSLETGRYHPSLRLALRIGRFFGLPVEQIFIEDEEVGTDES